MIPSRFPPIAPFDRIASHEDLDLLLELEGWTNDRLAGPRLGALAKEDRLLGRPNSSVILAAFLHGSPEGQRFSTTAMGAWYASDERTTSVLEVANGMRRQMSLDGRSRWTGTFRVYHCTLRGDYVDIVGTAPELHAPGEESYPVSQLFGEAVRAIPELAGIRYDSVRRPGHENWVCYRPRLIEDVAQGEHLELDVPATGKVAVRVLEDG